MKCGCTSRRGPCRSDAEGAYARGDAPPATGHPETRRAHQLLRRLVSIRNRQARISEPVSGEAFGLFKRELEALQRRLEAEPAAAWKVSPTILEANINA